MPTWTLYALIAVIAWGLAPVFDKLLARELSPWTIVLIRTFAAMIIITVYAVASGSIAELRALPEKNISPWVIVGAAVASALLGGLVGQLANYQALAMADASRVVPMTSTYPLVAALAAVAIYREPLTPYKVVGTLLIIVGVIMVSGVLSDRTQ
ncbi:MAG: EamA family transporter [candidate division WS1 bacterium]|jgi:transporter family protein|nr:EamA family transporter [candidate division WS1 bacterium]